MKIVLFLIVYVSLAVSARGDLILDQSGSDHVSGGLGTPVIQSFIPQASNIAAVEVSVIGTAVFTSDLTVNLYTEYTGGVLSGLLRSATVLDVPRGTVPLIQWNPVAVSPGQVHYLEFLLDGLVIGVGVNNPYPAGAVLVGGGNLFGGNVDAYFRTYSVIPEPTTLSCLLVSSAVVLRRRRRG